MLSAAAGRRGAQLVDTYPRDSGIIYSPRICLGDGNGRLDSGSEPEIQRVEE
jgi:hypothetical protein